MTLNLRYLLLLPIIFFFLPSFEFILPGTNKLLFVFSFVLIPILLLMFIIEPKKNISKFFDVIKNTPLKYYLIFITLIILNTLFKSLTGIEDLGFAIYSLLLLMLLGFFAFFIYLICLIGNYISYYKFLNFFILLFWINLVLGFIAYLGQLFDITFITNIFDFFANGRILAVTNGLSVDLGAANYIAFGLPRLDGLFEEPGFYAKFLLIFLPMVYVTGTSRYKIYENKVINLLIKRTIIPFTLVSMLLTLSPIFFIYTIIFSILFYYKKVLLLLKKHIIIILFLFISFIIILNKVDLSETYFSRIINVLTEIHSFEDFILIEPSLATRIICYVNSFVIFLQHPFSGVGFNNLINFMKDQMINSPLPLTPELVTKLKFAIISNSKMYYSKGFIYYMLAEQGIFIFGIFCYFYYKIMKNLNTISKKYVELHNRDYEICHMLKGLLLSMSMLFIYDFTIANNSMYIILTLAIMYVYEKKKYKD